MNKILNYFFDQFVFWNLKKIHYGYLLLIDFNGKEHFFGDSKSTLKAKIKINDKTFKLYFGFICILEFKKNF